MGFPCERRQQTLGFRIEADYGRDFVLTEPALNEDLVACRGFIDRLRRIIASIGY
jgi:hypothetical protein